jgi:GTP-binding protein EngB required for normal cell division
VKSHIGSGDDARSDVTTHLWPTLRFVDVPGMGYAESPDSAMASAAAAADRVPDGADAPEVVATGPRDRSRTWRGLLDRYLCVRDPLQVVFHLVDARHGITPVDKEVRCC